VYYLSEDVEHQSTTNASTTARGKISHLVDDDGRPEEVVIVLVVINRDLDSRRGRLLEMRQLLPQHLISRGIGVVVLGVNVHAGIAGRCGVDDNIAPPLVVVDAESNQEETVALRALETQHARDATGSHSQDLLVAVLTPGSFVKVGFLHDAVQGGASGLDDVHTDHVRSHLDKLKR
jgi:hypothetical protein